MIKQLFTLAMSLTIVALSQAQVIFQEDFESGNFPAGWTQDSGASDGGWLVGTASGLSSQYWDIPENGSSQVAVTNDDGCNCDKVLDRLITPPLDFSGVSGVALSVDILFGKSEYEGFTEQGTIEVSLDGASWTVVKDLEGQGGWNTVFVDLSAYAGENTVYLSFHYSDEGGWLFGLGIDDVSIFIPAALDGAMAELKYRTFGEETSPVEIKGTAFNNGTTPITSIEIGYSVDGGVSVPAFLDGLNIQPFESFEFNHPTPWTPLTAGNHEIVVSIVSVNGGADGNANNNSLSFEIEIYPLVIPPNRITDFLAAEPVFTTVATVSNELDKPTDLDFFPILSKNELWIVNERTEGEGGSTLTIYDAGTPEQNFLHRVDGNSWHFMSLPTGIAFSDNFNFATSTGVKDANHSGGTFTGPALWSSDPLIYAQPSGGNGSHLDMLHGSPYCMGIASETDNIFWVFDGWNETIVRYDFQEDHGPGNDYHGDALVKRYTEIVVKRDGDVPSHMVIDKATDWLYAVDNGNNRVIRLDIHSGEVVGQLPLINEPLAEHSQMGNVDWEVIIDNLDRPCGIEIIGNRLLVGEYETGEILIYDIDNNFTELGRIATGLSGLTGLKIGPDGSIWYTNRLENTVTRLEPGEVSATEEQQWLAEIQIMPNPTSGILVIDLPQLNNITNTTIEITDVTGKKLMAFEEVDDRKEINLGALPNGLYFLSIFNDRFSATRKIVLEK